MLARPVTRNLLWAYLGFYLICAPISTLADGLLLVFIGFGLPLIFSLIAVGVFARTKTWNLFQSRVWRSDDLDNSFDLNEIEWVLVGKPMTRIDRKRYDLTYGSDRYCFWKKIDSNLCLKIKDGRYLRLDLYFYDGGKDFINYIKQNCSTATINQNQLSMVELNAFENGDSNRIFNL